MSYDEEAYEASMRETAQDAAFIERTMQCMEDFKYVDGEGLPAWHSRALQGCGPGPNE